MPFKRYINSLDSTKPFKLVINVMLISLFLSACSTTPELDKAHSDVTEEVSLEAKTKNKEQAAEILNKETEQEHFVPAINLYLQQQLDKPIVIEEAVQRDYQQALILMKEKKWQQAQTLLGQVILKQPTLSGSYVNKAIIAKQQGKLDEAQSQLAKAIEVNNLNLHAHHLQGQIYRLQGEFESSEQSYLAALAIWPDFSEAHASMAILLELYRGRLLDAYKHYRAYLTLKPNDEEVQRWLAGLEIKIKRAGLELPIEEPVIATQTNEQATDKKLMTEKELIHD